MNIYSHVMVMGAGGVGGYFGGRIAERSSADVTFVARGKHLQAMQADGLRLRSVDGDSIIPVNAIEHPKGGYQPDLIIFTVKSYDTAAAIEKVRPIVNEETQILTIQNGIENYPMLVEVFGADHVMQGFCKIGVGISEPGIIRHKALGEITVGEKDGCKSDRLERLQKLCEIAEIPLHISADIDREIWLKFAWNCVFNMLTTVGDVTVEKLFSYPETEKLCYNVYDELMKVAQAEGVNISPEDGEKFIEAARKLEGFTTSTYQDRQKGKKLEFEAFTGAIVRLAGKHNLYVPYNESLYALLKLIDNES